MVNVTTKVVIKTHLRIIIEMTDIYFLRWVDGKPVGTEGSIEVGDGSRKSIIVNDPRLPEGWVKHLSQRTSGMSVGKWDTIIVG